MARDDNLGVEALMPVLRLFSAAPDAESRDARYGDEILAERPVVYQDQWDTLSSSLL
jgi:hypothetical protein